jgi:hypothetical protein
MDHPSCAATFEPEASLAMMFGPECCSVLEKREVAGMAMSAIMVTGILDQNISKPFTLW